MPDKAWYRDWFNSPYYHLLYQHRDTGEAGLFIDQLLRHMDPPAGSLMLDIACGKGRHSHILHAHGYDVTGIDLSAASIAAAKQMESDKLHFYQHDMRLPFWINYFDYAFNFFTSFGYFRTRREHDNAIRTISQSIRKSGLFVIDYLNVHYTAERLESTCVLDREGVQFHIARWQDEDFFFKQIQVTDEAHPTPHHLYTERVAKFTLGDFTDMMSYQGLQVQEVFGDYDLGHYDTHTSPRMIIVARKL